MHSFFDFMHHIKGLNSIFVIHNQNFLNDNKNFIYSILKNHDFVKNKKDSRNLKNHQINHSYKR